MIRNIEGHCKSAFYIITTYHMQLGYHMLFHWYIVYTQVLVYCILVSFLKYTKFLIVLGPLLVLEASASFHFFLITNLLSTLYSLTRCTSFLYLADPETSKTVTFFTATTHSTVS